MWITKNAYTKLKINKDTILCCSFARDAGSFGCFVHNNAFEYLDLNYIYKSFSINDVGKAMHAMRTLNIRGAGITMPYKKEVIKYLDKKSDCIDEISACNTVVNNDGLLYGDNTDFLGLKNYFSKVNQPATDNIYIVGTGGMSLAVQSACRSLNIDYEIIARRDLHKVATLKKAFIFNATPLTKLDSSQSNNVVYASVNTESGMYLAILQASFQFKLYTNKEFPIEYIFKCVNKQFNKNLLI